MTRLLFLLALLLCWIPATQADFLDKVGTIIDIALNPSPNTEKPTLISANSAEHKLPSHWRSYWLTEPELGARIFLADTGKVSAPAVFLIHGLGQNGLRDWLSVVPELEKQYRVILIDLPGFANSPSIKTKLSPSRYADLLHFVKPYFSNKAILVVGHSMGGAVTLRYAQRYPDDIEKIALIDAAGILQRTAFIKHSATDRLPVNPETMPNALLNYAIGLQTYSNSMIEKLLRIPDPTEVLGKSEFAWGITLQDYPNINAALSLMEENFSSAIFEQSKPVAILWGDQDMIAPVRTGEMLHANLANSQLQKIIGAGHVPMKTHPQEVNRWLQQALRPQADTTHNQSRATEAQMQIEKQDYQCTDSTGGKISGIYGRITISKCTGLLLDNIIANELVVADSTIEIQNSRFLSPTDTLNITNSVLMMTGGKISGNVTLNKSRIDFAGVSLSNTLPFIVKERSRLVLSVSRAANNRYLHQDIQLEKTSW